MFYIGLIYKGKHEKIFLFETTRPKALIFGLKYYLVDLYQRGMCFKGLFWHHLEPKTESCFSPISSYWFVRRIAQV